jgi:hypothetical protein
MMHYFGLVITAPFEQNLSTAGVGGLMEPHRETYNEATEETHGHWDFWRIGGRWDGYLIDDQDCAECDRTNGHHSYDPVHESIERNHVVLPRLREDCYGAWLLTPEGEWIEKVEPWQDDPDFFAKVRDDDAAFKRINAEYEKSWRRYFIEKLAEYRGYAVVGVDIHR